MKIIIIICMVCVLMCGGCVDIKMGGMSFIDTISVSEDGKVAMRIDEDIYVTDLKGDKFIRITEDEFYNGSVNWAKNKDELFYTEKREDEWILNKYISNKDPVVLLRERDQMALPYSPNSDYLSYMVFPQEEEFIGNLNIFETKDSRAYIFISNVYFDYEWLPGVNKIAVISAVNVSEDKFQGVLLIKDLNDYSEEIIFNGTFSFRLDYVDVTTDNNIIFSSEGDVYLYNLKTKETTKWQGPKGYDFRLPESLHSNLKGYVLAKEKGPSDWEESKLYLVLPSGKFISVPGWPIWIREPLVICLGLENLDIIVYNINNKEMVDLNKKFEEKMGKFK